MSEFYDKSGVPLDLFQWAQLLENREYSNIAKTILPDGKLVSTVWIGLDHRFRFMAGESDGPPLIFETMVFADGCEDVECERYSTLADAQAGHARIVAKRQLAAAEKEKHADT